MNRIFYMVRGLEGMGIYPLPVHGLSLDSIHRIKDGGQGNQEEVDFGYMLDEHGGALFRG